MLWALCEKSLRLRSIISRLLFLPLTLNNFRRWDIWLVDWGEALASNALLGWLMTEWRHFFKKHFLQVFESQFDPASFLIIVQSIVVNWHEDSFSIERYVRAERIENTVLEQLGGRHPEARIEDKHALQNIDQALILDWCEFVSQSGGIKTQLLAHLHARERPYILDVLNGTRLGDEC